MRRLLVQLYRRFRAAETDNAVHNEPHAEHQAARDDSKLREAAFRRLLGYLEGIAVPDEVLTGIQDELDRIAFLSDPAREDVVRQVNVLEEIDWVLDTLLPDIQSTQATLLVRFDPGMELQAEIPRERLRRSLFEMLVDALRQVRHASGQLEIDVRFRNGTAIISLVDHSDRKHELVLTVVRRIARQTALHHLTALVVCENSGLREAVRRRLQHAGVRCSEEPAIASTLCITDNIEGSAFRALLPVLQHQFVIQLGGYELDSNPGWARLDTTLTQAALERCLGRLAHSQAHHRTGRVLVVDDNPSNTRLLDAQLTGIGFKVDVVESGKDAIAAAIQREYDLVLTDLQMPDMDGVMTTRKLHECRPQLPVFGLTADVAPTERSRCIDAGMIDVLQKPLRLDRLKRIVRSPHARPRQTTTTRREPVYDISLALENADNRVEVAREMLDLLINDLPADIARMNAVADDLPALGRLNHALHGALQFCGATSLLTAVQQLDSAIRDGEAEHVSALLQIINSEAALLQGWYRDHPDALGITPPRSDHA